MSIFVVQSPSSAAADSSATAGVMGWMRSHLGRTLLGFHLLSLDAPLVAVVWQALFARTFGVSLPLPERILLALSVWLAYSGDRWLDGLKLKPGRPAAPRHRFAARHRRVLAGLWMVIAILAVGLAWHHLSREVWRQGWGLVLGIAAYFGLNQLWPRTRQWPLPRELLVGICLGLGTWLFVQGHRPVIGGFFLVPLGLFSLLCGLNCLLISCWDREQDRAQNQPSLATGWAGARPWFSWLTLMLGLVATLLTRPAIQSLLSAISLSCLLLLLLERTRHRLPVELSGLCADLTLLTPLLFL